jgi:D-cysteine desulfhydrase
VSARRLRLFDELPELEGAVPWTPLAETPTPVESCATIEPYLGRDRVWVKRDDQVGSLYGGNKVRRFEFLLADAKAKGAREIVTAGGLASTQVLATILYGKKAGFDVTAVLFDQPVTRFAREALAIGHAAGGRLVRGGGYVGTAIRFARAALPRDSYVVLPGASTPLANLGYVDAMLELAAQVDAGLLPRPDRIVLPCGSGGTLAGLAVGAALLGWSIELVGVRITELLACNRFTIRFIARSTLSLLKKRAPKSLGRRRLELPRISVFHGAIGRGYGYATSDAIAAIPEVLRLVGVPGEVTYSGKGLAGLRAVGRAHPAENILYWQTLSSRGPRAADPLAAPPGFERYFEGDVPC